MTQEDKELLLKDLCSRLPYHIVVNNGYENAIVRGIDNLDKNDSYCLLLIYSNPYDDEGTSLIDDIKPYLRPMSSMTEEEKEEYINIKQGECNGCVLTGKGDPNTEFLLVDFFNVHHFDYRGLIKKGLALEAPEGMYNIKEK